MTIIRLANVILAGLAVTGSARAADMNAASIYKAPPAVAVSSWTGFYAGLGLGFRASRTDATTTSITLGGVSQSLAGSVTSQPLDGMAFRASPYLGVNWQFAPRWVVGIEGDVGFASQTTTLAGIPLSPFSRSSLVNDGFLVKTTWDASLRGRLGLLLTPSTLAYATGGVAWQHFEVTSACNGNISTSFCIGAGIAPAVITDSATRAGWTVGGGIEAAFWGHWLARAEYRYADFGSGPFSFARSSTNAALNPIVDSFDVKVRSHTATFGLAYKFGDPVAHEELGNASLPPAVGQLRSISWTGPYAGFGVAARTSRTDLTTTSQIVTNLVTGQQTVTDLTSATTGEPFDGNAFRASPYIGFNWQFAPRWITGVEVDAGFANQTTTLTGLELTPDFSLNGQAADGLSVKTTWDTSLRGRLGFLLIPTTLAYVTGGAAWQHYDVDSACLSARCVTNGFAPSVIANSTTKVGWTVGSGIETMLWGQWLARAEYRYADFGSAAFTISRIRNGIALFTENFDVVMRTHTVTFGLAYKFN